jgi:cytoskeletal protein CcmA (bactofilin family)
MANRQNTLLLKRSNVIGKIPPLSGLTLGEMALNTADAKLYTLYTSGSVTPSEVRQIGWDRISRTGDTVTGDFNFFGDVKISGSSLPNGYALTVTGDTNLNGDVYVQGDLFYSGSVVVTGSTIIEDGLTANTIYTDYIDFNNTLTPLPPDLEGRIYWDDDNGSLSLGMHGSQVVQKIGLEQYYYVKNQSGATIENGRVVRAAGTLGSSGRILGEYMIADGTIPPKFTLGVATEDIINGDDGYVTEFGLVRGIDTTGSLYGEVWSGGTVLYVSPTIPGGLTSVEPTAPDLHIEMAIVIDADANGSIFVRPNRYPYLYDLQQVNYSANTENNLDILQWNSSNLTWDKTNTPSFSGLTVFNNINHFGNYILDGNISQTGNYNVTGNTTTNGTVDIIGSGTGCTFSVTGKTCLNGNLEITGDVNVIGNLTYDGNLIITGATTITSGLTVTDGVFTDFINITTTPNENNDLIQILGRNSSTGLVEYRDVKTIGNNITIVTGSTYSATTTDNVIGIDSSTNTVTLYLPDSVSSGRLRYDIKDIGVNSFNNPITVQAAGSNTIITTSVVSSFELSADGGAVILVNTGTGQWWQM